MLLAAKVLIVDHGEQDGLAAGLSLGRSFGRIGGSGVVARLPPTSARLCEKSIPLDKKTGCKISFENTQI